jgi:hypothetical protein
VSQISGTTSSDAPTAAPADEQPSDAAAAPDATGFAARGRIRRRARFLRKARELAYRDLGGLVFDLHRFGQRNDPLVLAKLTLLGRIDGELRALEHALGERHSITVLREAGITPCPRCAAIHSSEDRFCPSCGLSMGRHPDLPIAGAATAPAAAPAPADAAAPRPAWPATGASPAATQAPASSASPATQAPAPAIAHPVAPADPVLAPRAAGPSTAEHPATPGGPATSTPGGQPASEPDEVSGPGEVTEILGPPAHGS